MKIFGIALFLLFLTAPAFSESNCVESANVVKPSLSANAARVYGAKLAEAKAEFEKNPNDPDAHIWLGRRTAYLGNYKEAIEVFTNGISKYPKDARFYRHRGHRMLTIRCFDEAIVDLESAAKLIKGRADEIEPDGLPNSRNLPTSTLQSNIWYHLGLAHYLKGDFNGALRAYRNCLKVSKNPDMLVATTNWLYITLRRLGKNKDAANVLKPIKEDLDIIENDGYYKLLILYQGKIKVEDLLNETNAGTDDLSDASIGYGLGNWLLLNGEKERAGQVFRRITGGSQWSSFGYIAAEVELERN